MQRRVIGMMALAAALFGFWPHPALALEPVVGSGGITYVSGGVGQDEREEMEALAGVYNLKLEFAVPGGAYLGDTVVRLRGPASLDAVSGGPWFLAKVPPGTYAVTAEAMGVAKTQTVTVGGSGQKTVVFFW